MELESDQGGFLGLVPLAWRALGQVKIRKDWSSADKALIIKYGGLRINRLTVVRQPIKGAVDVALNVITIGKWEKAKAKYGFDKLFHLWLKIDVIDRNGEIVSFCLEKNETPRFYIFDGRYGQGTETQPVIGQVLWNLRTFLQRGIDKMGDRFWEYSAFDYNCQNFLMNILDANDLMTPQLRDFILQDIKEIVAEMPTYVTHVSKVITDKVRQVRTLLGKGLDVQNTADKNIVSS
jgi:hypothetical protein